MSDLENRINDILGDPEQMKKISQIAQSLMGGESPTQGGIMDALGGLGNAANNGDDEPLLDADMLSKIGRLMSSGGGRSREERALLEAMRPYLSEKRRKKMDKALKLARLASVAKAAMGEMGGDGGL